MFVDLIYRFVILIVAFCSLPYIFYASIRYKKYRKGWKQKLLGDVPTLSSPCGARRLWFHGVSVGEINLLKPIVEELERNRPNWEYVVSSTSETGYELAVKLFGAKTSVFYCPLDFTFPISRALRRLRPTDLILVELELWPNLIRLASRTGVRVSIVNGRISDRSFKRYRLARRALATTFRRIALVAAQDEIAARYFQELSPCPERIVATGSVKFDGAKTDRQNAETKRLRELAQIGDNDVVFIAGSTQSPEEEGALEVFRRLEGTRPNLKLIVVPRHRERFEEVARILDASGLPWTRRSDLPNDKPRERVLLVDAVGELGAWWGLADVAFVGGSWGDRGGQNMLEPAGYGVAVSFGGNTKNLRVISEALLKHDAGVVVRNVDELTDFVRRAVDDPDYRHKLGNAAQRLTIQNVGASRRTLDAIARLE